MSLSKSIGIQARWAGVAAVVALVSACGGGGGGGDATAPAAPAAPPPVPTHTVGGTVSGLAGTLVLQNNAGDDLKLTADGKFTFSTAAAEGSAYDVSVRTQPLWQFCSVTKGSGTASADVGDVAVACAGAAAEVSTWAGSGAPESLDGARAAAAFASPIAVAVDKQGGLFVSDMVTRLLRKVSPSGDVSTFAGNTAAAGAADGNGTAASFRGLAGLALDADGNVYGADFAGNTIRKITPAADVTTFAGNGAGITLDGQGTAAGFNAPISVATGPDGTLYVVEIGGNVVRKITPDGTVSTLAGAGRNGFADGRGNAAYFNGAFGIAVDAGGTVYVADTGNSRIRKITPDGVVTTFAGSNQVGNDDGTGSAASFGAPFGLAIDTDGNLYVSDIDGGLIRRITPAGVVSTLAGQAGVYGAQNGAGPAASFTEPAGLAVDAAGSVYVADSGSNLIRKITPVPAH